MNEYKWHVGHLAQALRSALLAATPRAATTLRAATTCVVKLLPFDA